MKDILKSFAVGVAVSSALVGGSYAASRAIDGLERGIESWKERKARKEAEAAAQQPAETVAQ